MQDFQKILEQVARDNNTTVEEVRKEIDIAIKAGMSSHDPAVQKEWSKMSKKGKTPTAEEVLAHLSKTISGRDS